MRTADQRDLSQLVSNERISLRGLIDFFSRKSGADDLQTWRDGPFRLKDLVRTPGRGARNG